MQKKLIVLATLLSVAALAGTGCAGKNPPTLARDVAVNGQTLLTGVKSLSQIVITSEAAGLLQRNDAVKSVEAFRGVGIAAQSVAEGLDILVTLAANDPQYQTTIDRILAGLDQIDSGTLAALVPIGNETVRAQMSEKALTIIRVASNITKQILILRR